MLLHDKACAWARCNRSLIAKRIGSLLSIDPASMTLILDVWHNDVEERVFEDGISRWVHRKGAAPSDKGVIVVPGSRSDFTYVMNPVGSQDENGE